MNAHKNIQILKKVLSGFLLVLFIGPIYGQSITNISTTTVCEGGTITFDVTGFGEGDFAVIFPSTTSTVTSAPESDTNGSFDITVPTGAISGFIDLQFDSTAMGPSITLTNVAVLSIFSSASISGLLTDYCETDASSSLVGIPLGGTFSASPVNDQATISNDLNIAGLATFDPSQANIGGDSDEITVTYSFANGACPDVTATTDVFSAVTATAPSDITYLESQGSVTLSDLDESPTGGTFTFNGNTVTTFNPSSVGIGAYILTYTVSNGSCTDSDDFIITVEADPGPTVTGFNPSTACAGSALTINGDNFSGSATVQFQTATGTVTVPNSDITLSSTSLILTIPSTAVSGQVIITVNGTIFNGFSINLVDNPPVIFGLSANQVFCNDDASVSLSASPSGGTFSGNGVSGSTFNPSNANTGNNTITYTVSNACGTDITSTVTVEVVADLLTSVTTTQLNVGQNADPVDLFSITNILPASSSTGGFFSGTGVSNNQFDPDGLAFGTYVITYTFLDPNSGCSDQESFNLEVSEETQIVGVSPIYCRNDPDVIFGRDATAFPPNQFPNLDIFINDFGFANFFQTDFTSGSESFTIRPSQVTFSGLYTIGLNYFGGSGGSQVVIATIQIADAPATPTFSLPKTDFCPQEGESIFTGDISGGIFLIDLDTIVNGVFDPADYVSGTYDISYVVNNGICSSPSLSQQITIFSTQEPSFSNLDDEYCSNETDIQLVASPSGGTFSGGGITAGTNTFSPNSLGIGVGTTDLSYSYIDNNQCTVSTTQQVTLVDPNDGISFSGLPTSSLCVNDGALTLTPTVLGGTFSVVNPDGGSLGITGNSFDPAVAGTGTHTISYSFPNAAPNDVCTTVVSQTVLVNSLPSVTFNDLSDPYCETEDPFFLSGFPQGGTFNVFNSSNVLIASITGNALDPSSIGTGDFTISYTVTDLTTNCTSTSALQTLVISDPPTITFTGPEIDNQYCEGDAIQTLTGTPSGGTFSGNGIISPTGLFDPTGLAGTNPQITYTVEENGCLSTNTIVYTVDSPPNLFIGGLANNEEICVGSANVPLTGIPAGGTFSIINPDGGTEGLEMDQFNPTLAGIGTHTISYDYTDPGTTCFNTISISVNVLSLPTPSFSGLSANYCNVSEFVTLSGTPSGSGGVFSIVNPGGGDQGVAGNIFNPFDAGLGTHTITYTFTNDNGCTNTFSQDVTVLDQPTVDFTDASNTYEFCADEAVFSLAATPVGGIFSGPGIEFGTNNFNPTLPGVGTFDVVYEFTDGNGCVNTDTAMIIVNELPDPQISGLTDAYCVDAIPDTLSTNIPGSIFSISNQNGPANPDNPGLLINGTDTIFVPSDAGVGSHTIFLENTDPITGCLGIDSFSLVVNPLPIDVSLIGLDTNYCVGGTTDVFQGIPSPSSGISGIFQLFDINGNLLDADLGTAFTPANFVKGQYDIQYTFTDLNACQATATTRVTIHPNPVASYLRDGNCESDTLFLFNESFFEPGDTGTITNFQWEYLGFIDFDENSSFPNPPPSTFDIQLMVGTEVGCQDDTLTTAQFIGADPTFDYFSTVACIGGFPSEFIIQDINDDGFGLESTDIITSIVYDFGDGDVIPINVFPAFHSYDEPGLYQSTVTFGTNQTCTQSVSRPVVVVPSVTSFPYFEDFETDQGGWNTLARSPDSTSVWEYGSPSGETINTAAGGTNAWATNLDGEYPANEDSWVYGPCFDLTQLARPMLSLDIWNDTQNGFDGVVIEWSTTGQDWSPLSEVGEGINWYNESVIIGQPGDQTIAPQGFSGQTGGWVSARVRLDQYKTADDFRIRIAFGSDGNNPAGTSLEGFAFDNVFIGERSRNVLFEHFTNLNVAGAQDIDEFLYDELLQNNFDESEFNPLDVVFMQYHIGLPSADVINLQNTADPSARSLVYGIDESGKAQINGLVFGAGDSKPEDGLPWQQIDLDQQMLPDPKFSILIPPASISGSNISASAIFSANEAIPFDTLDAHLVIVEDDVIVGNRTLQGVLRDMLPDATGTPYVQAWTAGQSESVSDSWGFDPTNVNANNLEVIAFIQDRNSKEILQVSSTRDVSIFVDVEDPVNLFDLTVFPNPASHSINLNFDRTVPENMTWIASDPLGRVIDRGILEPGQHLYELNTSKWTNGLYFLQIGSEDMGLKTEKIIISKLP